MLHPKQRRDNKRGAYCDARAGWRSRLVSHWAAWEPEAAQQGSNQDSGWVGGIGCLRIPHVCLAAWV